MKLKETLNLGKTAFPMRAGLPNERTSLAKRMEDAKLYQRRQELNVENRILPFMMASLCQRKYSRRACHEQDLKRYHCSF